MRWSPRRRDSDSDWHMRSPLARYLLWQIPGWLVAAAALAIVVEAFDASWAIVPGGVALLAIRDLLLYPAMRATFRPASPARPVGARGVVVEDLQPAGMIRLRGELWRARTRGDRIGIDEPVIVVAADGLTLLVKRPDPADSARPTA